MAAQEEVFLDFPNFRVLHLIAATYSVGSVDREVWLARSRGALEVWTGIRKCVEGAEGISEAYGDALTRETRLWVAGKMCGAAYEALYESRVLEHIPEDAMLVERYLAVKLGKPDSSI
jgi:hypothetical protein